MKQFKFLCLSVWVWGLSACASDAPLRHESSSLSMDTKQKIQAECRRYYQNISNDLERLGKIKSCIQSRSQFK